MVVNGRIASIFWQNLGVLNVSHVTEMNWDPIGIVGMVQSKEPGEEFCQSMEVHTEGLPHGSHIDQSTQLQCHDCLTQYWNLGQLTSLLHQTPKARGLKLCHGYCRPDTAE